MALAPLPPIPNTRLVDDPTRDAIWRRYLEQLFNRVTPLTNVHNDLSGLQGGTTAEYYHLTQAQHATVTSYLHNNLNGLQGGTAGEYYHLTATQHSTVTSFGSFTNNRVLFTSPTSTITTSGDLTFDSTTSTFAADLIAGNGLTSTRVIYAGASGLLSDSANLTFDGTILNINGVARVPAGSASVASIDFGTATYGIFSSGSNSVNISIGGTNAFAVNTLGITYTISGAGGDRRIQVINTSNTAGSGAKLQAQVAGTSAGDAYSQYNISGGINWAVGLDNSDSDSFKISQSATLGTNDYLTITTGGVVTLPTVNIDGGNIDSTAIGAATASTGVFTNISTTSFFTSTSVFQNVSTATLFATSTATFDNISTRIFNATSTATLALADINGGNIDATAIGAATASTGVFTNVSTTTLFSTSTATLPLVNIDGGNIDATAIGANTASTGVYTNVSTTSFFSSTGTFTGALSASSGVTAPNFVYESVALNDDQAGYWSFSAADSRGIAVISGNTDSAGAAMINFRVGSSIYCRSIASGISAGAVATTTGALTGTTGTNGDLTLSVTLTATGDRLYIENRTGATRGYTVTFLSGVVGIPTGFTTV